LPYASKRSLIVLYLDRVFGFGGEIGRVKVLGGVVVVANVVVGGVLCRLGWFRTRSLLVVRLIFGFTRGTGGLGVCARFRVIDIGVDEVKALFLPLSLLLLVLESSYGVRSNISIASVIERSRVVLVILWPLPLALVILFLPLTFTDSRSKTRALLLLITPIGFIKY
jgi:hypothetical protein